MKNSLDNLNKVERAAVIGQKGYEGGLAWHYQQGREADPGMANETAITGRQASVGKLGSVQSAALFSVSLSCAQVGHQQNGRS